MQVKHCLYSVPQEERLGKKLLFQTLVGRLIGRKGAFVNKIKATTDATLIVYPHKNRRLKLCSVEGELRRLF